VYREKESAVGLFDFLTPKYPAGAEPPTEKRPSRQERRAAAAAEAEMRRTTIGEAELREYERAGYRIRRGKEYVVVEASGHDWSRMKSFTVLGGGRYGRR
jgi:hypothetical protein